MEFYNEYLISGVTNYWGVLTQLVVGKKRIFFASKVLMRTINEYNQSIDVTLIGSDCCVKLTLYKLCLVEMSNKFKWWLCDKL